MPEYRLEHDGGWPRKFETKASRHFAISSGIAFEQCTYLGLEQLRERSAIVSLELSPEISVILLGTKKIEGPHDAGIPRAVPPMMIER